jgi:hypothetical protein
MDEVCVYLSGREMGIMDHCWLVGPRALIDVVGYYPLRLSVYVQNCGWIGIPC